VTTWESIKSSDRKIKRNIEDKIINVFIEEKEE